PADFHVPSEYLTNIHIRDKLAAIKLSRYGEDLLFYLYYMNGGDLLQLLAAVELFNRDWRYHKEERVWITRAPGMEPTLKTNAYERGTYYFFDCLNWRKVAKEFHLEYDKLEERPHVPSTFNYNPAQQAF
ncbi:CCR4-NOT transcription complex subunit 2-like, partial [Scomber japonicus]